MELWCWVSRNVLCCEEKSNTFIVIKKLSFRTHCNLLHTINNIYPIEFIFEKCDRVKKDARLLDPVIMRSSPATRHNTLCIAGYWPK